jgi:hypothetical protein
MTLLKHFHLPDDCSPMIRETYDYWVSIHPDEGLPGRQHFDPLDILRLSSHIWMLDVEYEPLRFRVRRMGIAIVDFMGSHDPTGRYLDETYPNFESAGVRKHLEHAVKTGMPTFRRGSAVLVSRKKYVTSERIILPLASDGEVVDTLLNLTCFQDESNADYVENFG